MTFLVSRRLERNNVWGPTDRPIDRSLYVGKREEVVVAACATLMPSPKNGTRYTRAHVYVCLCVVCHVRSTRPGVNPRDVGGRQMQEERRTGMKAKESGTSAGTTSCKMPSSLCTHLHTAFHVCVATCEIQATLSFLPSSLPSLPDPSAGAHHVPRRAAFRLHLAPVRGGYRAREMLFIIRVTNKGSFAYKVLIYIYLSILIGISYFCWHF